MKKKYSFLAVLIVSSVFYSCKDEQNGIPKYETIDPTLQQEITKMDKKFFDAYNTCDLEKQGAIYDDNIEFFHDKGGLMTSKKEILEGTKKYICGKVTRELVENSIEVYPINNYGAVEIGFHKFHNSKEQDAKSVPSKFIIVWKKDNDTWKITKVVSLH